jgi:hypothetical protein
VEAQSLIEAMHKILINIGTDDVEIKVCEVE